HHEPGPLGQRLIQRPPGADHGRKHVEGLALPDQRRGKVLYDLVRLHPGLLSDLRYAPHGIRLALRMELDGTVFVPAQVHGIAHEGVRGLPQLRRYRVVGPAALDSHGAAFRDVFGRDLQAFFNYGVCPLHPKGLRKPDVFCRMDTDDGKGFYELVRLPNSLDGLVEHGPEVIALRYAQAKLPRRQRYDKDMGAPGIL